MTDADKIMHPQHLGTDPTDTRIRINPKIWIRSPDHFWFKFWRWRMFALSGCSCCFCSIFNFMFLSCIVLSACHSTWRINVSKLMVLVWFHLSWKLRNDRSNRFVEIFKLRNTRRGKLRPVAVGGRGGRSRWTTPGVKRSLSADCFKVCLSVNILNIVRVWNRINKIEKTCHNISTLTTN